MRGWGSGHLSSSVRPPSRSNSATDGIPWVAIVYCPAVSDLRSFMETAVEALCANYCRSREFWRVASPRGISPEIRSRFERTSEGARSFGFEPLAATCKNHGIVAWA